MQKTIYNISATILVIYLLFLGINWIENKVELQKLEIKFLRLEIIEKTHELEKYDNQLISTP